MLRSSSATSTRHEIAAVMQDINKRAQAFNAEREASMRAANKAENDSQSTLAALNTTRVAPREAESKASWAHVR